MKRNAFTLIELLVVIAIIAILIALLVPAVQKVRDSAARLQCQNQLKQIGIALHNFHNVNSYFPSGLMVPIGGGSGNLAPGQCAKCQPPPVANMWGSWLTMILPYMDQGVLYDQLNLNVRDYNNCTGANSPGATVVPAYICPSDYVPQTTIVYTGVYYFGVNSYFANAGTSAWPADTASLNGVMFYNSSVTMNQIADGTSNTLLAGERYSKDMIMADSDLAEVRGWAWTNENSGEDSLGDTAWPINSQAAIIGTQSRLTNFGSGHIGGANFLLCDGSVHFFSTEFTVSNQVNFQRLSVPNDGHTVQLED